MMQRRATAVILFLIGALLAVPPAAVGASPSTLREDVQCATMRYAGDCLMHDDCAFCCGAPIGQQCLNRSSAAYNLCPSAHLLEPNTSATGAAPRHCGDLCPALGATNCTTCVGMLWCYYCHSSGYCISPLDACLDGTVQQTCASSWPGSNGGSSSSGDEAWFHTVVYTSVATAVVVFAMALVLTWQRCRMRVVLGRLLRQETRPLLSPSNGQEQQPPHLSSDSRRAANAIAAPGSTTDLETSAPQHQQQGTELVPSAVVTRSAPTTEAQHHQRTAASADGEASSDDPSHHTGEDEDAALEDHASIVSSASDGMCQLCFESQAEIAFLPCYHVHCCTQCANKIRPNRATRSDINCPFCRQKIQAMVRLTSIVHKKVA